MNEFFKRYLLPGLVFQAAVIAGGYATGRELVEFFMPSGPWGGVLGLGVTMLVWSLVLMVSFELARRARTYDYRHFFMLLLGRGWFLFEIAYILLIVLIIAVMGAAAGEIAESLFGLPKLVGSLGMIAATGALLFYSNAVIERFLALSVGYLYLVYFLLIIFSIIAFGDGIAANFESVPVQGGWIQAGITYASYNVATIPAVFFCLRYLKRRRETLIAGALAGPIAIVPAILFYIAMMAFYPQISDIALPSAYVLGRLQMGWFEWAFQIAVLLTLVDTGVALLHSINERVAGLYRDYDKPMPRTMRPVIAVSVMVISVYAASAVGLVDLIAKGYGASAWVFLAIYVIPLLTWGVWLLSRRQRHHSPAAENA